VDAQTKAELREKLASLEHAQWQYWAEDLLKVERISRERRNRWEYLFRPYQGLTEEEKDQDRKWAEKVIQLLEEIGIID
jgi:hypothetical protein